MQRKLPLSAKVAGVTTGFLNCLWRAGLNDLSVAKHGKTVRHTVAAYPREGETALCCPRSQAVQFMNALLAQWQSKPLVRERSGVRFHR